MKHFKLIIASALLLSLFWVEASQAFSFCFSFGSANNSRAGYYNRPYHMPPFPPVGYPVYPYSPVMHGWYGVPLIGQPWVPAGKRPGPAPLQPD